MKVHKFIAPNVRLAMQQVKDALGDDAIILSNKKNNNQIELTATTEFSQVSQFTQPIIQKKQEVKEAQETFNTFSLDHLSAEINSLKKIITHNMSGISWNTFTYQHPLAINFFHQLFSLGFSANTVKQLITTLDTNWSIDTCIQSMSHTLQKWISINPELITKGGIFAFFGPSGGGKTQSVIKLGAYYRLKNPNKKIVFIYLDTAKTSGDKSLIKYAKILNAQFVFCDSADSLIEVLKHASTDNLILIDTANTNTPTILDNIQEMGRKNACKINFILTLPLTHQSELLNRYIICYDKILPSSLLLTKIDEATQMASGLSIALEKKIPICFYSKGTGIPEDIKPANINDLLRLSGLSHVKNTKKTQGAQTLAIDEIDTWKIMSAFK